MKFNPKKILLFSILTIRFGCILSQEDTLKIVFNETIETEEQQDLGYLKSNVLKFYGTGFLNAEYYFSIERVIKNKFSVELFLGLTVGKDLLGEFHSINSFYSYKPYLQLEKSHKPLAGFISKIGLKYYFGKYDLNGFYIATQVGFKTFNCKAFERQNGTYEKGESFTNYSSINKRKTIETRLGTGYSLNLNHFYSVEGHLKNVIIDGSIGIQVEYNDLIFFQEKSTFNYLYTYNKEKIKVISFLPFLSIGLGYSF